MVIRGNLFILSNIRDKWDHARDLGHLDHKASIKEATRDKGKHLMIHYHRDISQDAQTHIACMEQMLQRDYSSLGI
jgi:hypothetical protein